MKAMKPSSLSAFAALVLLSIGGCGLISSDVFRVTFDLPAQTYSFNTAQWGNLPSGQVPSVPCTSDSTCCTAGSAAGIDCTKTPLVCQTSMTPATCAAQIPESLASSINLSMQVPSLSQYSSVANISISAINYTVSNNTLNIALPPISIYLAPSGVTDPTSSQAQLFGTVPAIPAGTDPSGSVTLVPNAASIFQMFTTNLATPFQFIAATTVVVQAGTPVPSGAITVSVTGVLSAQP